MILDNEKLENDDVFIEVRRVNKSFGKFTALKDVSLKVKKGEFVSILGPSGCGKTTLLRVIAGMETQDSGRVCLNGKDITRLHTSKRNCGIVFQSYALFPNLTAEQNVSYGIREKGMTKERKRTRAKELLELVGLGEIGGKHPAQLSGGQQQRVALARALATSPSMLLLDEPLSALDAKVRLKLRQEIRSLQKRLGITTIMVTHDQEEALTMADRIVVMKGGELIQHATPQEIYNNPGNSFVAGFIGTMNFLPSWKVGDSETIGNGRISLRVRKDVGGPLVGKDVTIGIRPEDIQMHGNSALHNTVTAVVESVEFRGAMYRVRLSVHDDISHIGPSHIEVELTTEKLRQLDIQEHSIVAVHFPEDRLLLFGDGRLEALKELPGAINA